VDGLFEQSVEITFEGVLWVKKGKVLRVNPQFERIFQMNALDVVGLPLLQLVHPSSRELVKGIIEKMERKIVSHYGGVQLSLQHPTTGETIPIVMMGFALHRPDGEMEMSIKKMMKAPATSTSSWYIPKWIVSNWPNVAAIIATLAAGVTIFYQKASQLVLP